LNTFAAQTSPSTNTPPAFVTAAPLAPTNPVVLTPSLTNHPPSTPAKTPYVPTGADVRSSFSGKFVVPGRTLRLPAPEAEHNPQRPDGWNRALTLAMNMTQGNSDTLRYGLGLDAAKESEQDTTRVRARAAYGESEDQKDTENATAFFRYDRQLNRRFYALGDIDWLTDTIADIDYRVIGILSPGIHLWRDDRTVCKMEIGAGYLAEKKGEGHDAFAAGRAAGIVEHILNAHVLTWASVEYLPKLADPSVFYLNTEFGLVSMLTRDLNLNITLEDRYDNAPAIDRSSNDLTFTTAVSLRF
jgi:putative salt-induced outer membrane protein YdiY